MFISIYFTLPLLTFYTKNYNFLTDTPIYLISIETERKDCFNKVYKIIINMA